MGKEETKKFQILNKKFQFTPGGIYAGTIKELIGKFPKFIPASRTKRKYPASPLLHQGEDFLIYGKNLSKPHFILKFEAISNGRVKVWKYFKLLITLKAYYETIINIMDGISPNIILPEPPPKLVEFYGIFKIERTIDNQKMRFHFLDPLGIERHLDAMCRITLKGDTLTILVEKIRLNGPSVDQKSALTSETLPEILERSVKEKKPWWQLMNVIINLKEISYMEFIQKGTVKQNLFLHFYTPYGPMTIEFITPPYWRGTLKKRGVDPKNSIDVTGEDLLLLLGKQIKLRRELILRSNRS